MSPRHAMVAGWFMALAFPAAAEEVPQWISELKEPTPGRFAPLEPGEARYRFGWSGFTAAQGKLTFSRPAADRARVDLQAGTTGFVRTLWQMDATAFATCTLPGLEPIRVRQREAYRGGRTLLTAQEYAPGEVLRTRGRAPSLVSPAFFEDARADADLLRSWSGSRPKTIRYPRLFDLHSALLLIRSQPLTPGESYRLFVFQGTSAYLASVRVIRHEPLSTAAGRVPAIRLDLSLRPLDKQYQLKAHPTFKRATGWFTNDARRLPLRIEAEIMVGKVWAELEGATPVSLPH